MKLNFDAFTTTITTIGGNNAKGVPKSEICDFDELIKQETMRRNVLFNLF